MSFCARRFVQGQHPLVDTPAVKGMGRERVVILPTKPVLAFFESGAPLEDARATRSIWLLREPGQVLPSCPSRLSSWPVAMDSLRAGTRGGRVVSFRECHLLLACRT